jgi:alpha-beta hydrolase superfamily lysophospholipase
MTVGATRSDLREAIPPAIAGEVRQTRSHDGTVLAYRSWGTSTPESDAAIYLHGLAGHSLWFSEAASRLAPAGVSVYGLDRRGSGLNINREPGHLPNYGVMLRDIEHFVGLARAEHPGRKVFLIAGCWGAKPGVVYAAHRQDRLDGLALIAPALSTQVKTPPTLALGVVVGAIFDERRRFTIPLTPEQYTDNPRLRAFVASDPRRLLKGTARLFVESTRLDRLVRRAPEQLRLPVFLALGERDAIVDLDGTRAWIDRVPSPDKTVRFYPEYAHILEFEEHKEPYLADLLAWFRDHGSAAATAPSEQRAAE